MFTKWSDIESWIRDNNFAHWVFTKNKPGSEDKTNDKIVDSNYYTGDFEDKLAMTKKYLLLNGGRAYGVAWDKPANTYNGAVCEVWLEADAPATPTKGVGYGANFDVDQLRESIRKEMQAEFDKREYEQKKAELEKERKEFEAEKTSAIGLVTTYLAPVAKALATRRMVAGMDTDAPVTADPIPPIQVKEKEPDTQEPEQDDFTDEEIDQLNELMARFKKVEPQYLLLIQKVVEMAESGDNTYCMAKNFLMKGTL